MLRQLLLGSVLIGTIAACSHHEWDAVSMNQGRGSIVGRYDTSDACVASLQKIGGFCGMDCHEDGTGLIDQCKSLLEVESH